MPVGRNPGGSLGKWASEIGSGSGGLSAATQAEMETGTTDGVAVTPLVAQSHPSAAKVWCSINSTGGLESPSYNIDSITDVTTGLRTVVFDTDFSSVVYGLANSFKSDTTTNIQVNCSATLAVGSCSHNIRQDGVLADFASSLVVFGDQT